MNLLNIHKVQIFIFEVFFTCSCLKFRIPLGLGLLSTLLKSVQQSAAGLGQLGLAVDHDQNFFFFFRIKWKTSILSLSFNF